MKERSAGLERPDCTMQVSTRTDAFAPALLIIGLVLVSNLNALCAGFVWDDRALVTGNVLIKHWNTLPMLFRQPFLGIYYRPVVMLSFALEYAIWGLRPFGFHLTNLLLHTANSILVFMIIGEVLRRKEVALLATLLFTVHPAHKGVVANADRTGILSAFFFLCSIVFYIRYRRAADRRSSILFFAGSCALCGLGFFSKEEVIALPLVLILVDAVLFGEGLKLRPAARIVRYIPFFSLAALYLSVRAHVLGAAGGFVSAFAIEPVRRLMTIPAILVDYLLLLLFPLHLDFEPRTALAGSLGEPRILFSLLFLIALAAAIPPLAKRTRAGVFGLLWYLIVFIPMSNIVPIYAEGADSGLFTPIHFLYLPSIGIFICAAYGLEGILNGSAQAEPARGRRRSATVFFCCMLFLFSLLSINRNFVWKDELRFYKYVVDMHPAHHRMRVNLGNVYLERGEMDAAVNELERAVIIAPNVASYRNSLALAYQAKGWFERAIEQFRQGLLLDPNSSIIYTNLAAIYRERGELRESIAAGRKALELAPSSAAVYVNLGLAYKDAGILAEAEKQFNMALWVDPDSAEAHNGLGTVYALQNRFGLARREWEKALRIRPGMTEAHENLQRLQRMGH